MKDLRAKRIWLTGASSGIGEALAYALAEAGAELVLTARTVDALQRVRAACLHPERHQVLVLDLSDADAVAGQMPQIIAQLGALDMVIHCAGIGQRASIAQTTLAVDRRIMEVNYFSVVAITRALLPVLSQRPQAKVVAVASAMGRISVPRRSAYAASKHALLAFMDALRAELHDTRVSVLSACPGYIATGFAEHALRGDGQLQGVADAGKHYSMDARACAAQIVRAIRRGRAEVFIGGKEIFGVYIQRWLPALYRWLIARLKIS